MNQAQILLRARDYLFRLNQYIDPLTGKYLPQESVLQDGNVRKSVYITALRLERIVAYDCDWKRLPFAPDPDRRRVVNAAPRTLGTTAVANLISRTCDITRTRPVDFTQLLAYLSDRGYLERSAETRYTLTPRGSAAGLRTRESNCGTPVIFTPAAQRLLLDNLDDLAEYCKTHSSEETAKTQVPITAASPEGENLQRDLQVVRALSQEQHPFTGQRLPQTDPACQERLKTCFCYVIRALERALELGYYSAKQPFSLTRAAWESIPVSDDPCTLNVFLDRVNAQLSDPTATLKMNHLNVRDLLIDAGLLTQLPGLRGQKKTVISAEGEALGICQTNAGTPDGPYEVRTYSKAAQQYMISLLEPFVKE